MEQKLQNAKIELETDETMLIRHKELNSHKDDNMSMAQKKKLNEEKIRQRIQKQVEDKIRQENERKKNAEADKKAKLEAIKKAEEEEIKQ